jgi:hypothetical protein
MLKRFREQPDSFVFPVTAKKLFGRRKGFRAFHKTAKALVRSGGLEPPRCYPLAPESLLE